MTNSEWDVFPDDDDDADLVSHEPTHDASGEGQMTAAASAGVLHLTQHFFKTFHVPLSTCRVAVVLNNDEDKADQPFESCLSCWNSLLSQRGVQPIHIVSSIAESLAQQRLDQSSSQELFDVILTVNATTVVAPLINRHLVPGGLMFLMKKTMTSCIENLFSADPNIWNSSTEVFSEGTKDSTDTSAFSLVAYSKVPCPVNTDSCRHWLPSKHSKATEQTHLNQATVVLSSAQCIDVLKQSLSSTSPTLILSSAQHHKAVKALANFGYCIVRRILDPARCAAYGQAVLQDLQAANTILRQKYQVDVYQPQTNPDSYRELSMREDLRMDLRDGPQLRQLRHSTNHLFWQQPDLVRILQQVMYPRRDEYRHGNFGRYNFDGIAEETVDGGDNNEYDDEPYPTLNLSSVGGIVSLPGAADQAVHADTPHLFEHENCLPAHYINAFTPGCYHDDPRVGGTAFVHESHQLSFTAKYFPTRNTLSATAMTALKEEMYSKFLVRPWLQPGDVLLFDCRLLHFGLANRGEEARPLIYTNITHAWFHDPKNWDDRQAIFDQQNYDNSATATANSYV